VAALPSQLLTMGTPQPKGTTGSLRLPHVTHIGAQVPQSRMTQAKGAHVTQGVQPPGSHELAPSSQTHR
jgi:hypothetical protein